MNVGLNCVGWEAPPGGLTPLLLCGVCAPVSWRTDSTLALLCVRPSAGGRTPLLLCGVCAPQLEDGLHSCFVVCAPQLEDGLHSCSVVCVLLSWRTDSTLALWCVCVPLSPPGERSLQSRASDARLGHGL